MKFHNFKQAEEYLNKKAFDQKQMVLSGEVWIKRANSLMYLLGNPQDKLKVVHIAGTSGKGSTAYLISHLLNKAYAFKTGLTVSPHIINVRERVQLNNGFISEGMFVKNLNQIYPALEKAESLGYGPVSYFETITALAFYTFYKEKVDYSVVETGMGGEFDATNTVSREDKICVLTKVGFDHTQHLGNTLEKIALTKSGIIQNKNLVVTYLQNEKVNNVLIKKAKQKNAILKFLDFKKLVQNIKLSETSTKFDFLFQDLNLKNLEISLVGKFQAENSGLALSIIYLLSQRDNFLFLPEETKKQLKLSFFPGRMEYLKINKRKVVLDGAHNYQKMQALKTSLVKIYPGKKLDFLVAFKEGKDFEKMLKLIFPIAKSITITTFGNHQQDFFHSSVNVKEVEKICQNNNFKNLQILEDLKVAINKLTLKKDEEILVITGSLYLVAQAKYFLLDRKNL